MTALLFLLLQTPVPAPTPITVELDMVRARLSCRYERGGGFFCRPARLEIFREEAPVFEDTFAGVPGYLGRSPDRGPLAAEDLDGNGEPEVLLDLYSGGAHCCSSTRIYFRSGNGRYAMLSHDWGNAGYRLEDFDRDRKLEFLSADDAFSYAFTSYAASRRPPRIWRFEDGRLADVTRRHPKILEEDAASCWKAFAELSPKDPTGDDVRGLAGAYVADQCLLDRCKEGWEKLRAAYDKPDREKFFRELSSLLQKNWLRPPPPAVSEARTLKPATAGRLSRKSAEFW